MVNVSCMMKDEFLTADHLASGGEASVFKVRTKNGKLAAAKKYFEDKSASWQREYSIALALPDHENIVKVEFANITDEGRRILVSEYCAGGNLRSWLQARGKLQASHALQIVFQIACGLSALAEKKIIHGDIKPENIFLKKRSRPERWLIGDFGSARLLSEPQRGSWSLTKAYAPPEFYDLFATETSDVYSLGILLAELITGVRDDNIWHLELREKLPKVYALIGRMIDANPEERPHPSRLTKEIQNLMVQTRLENYVDQESNQILNKVYEKQDKGAEK